MKKAGSSSSEEKSPDTGGSLSQVENLNSAPAPVETVPEAEKPEPKPEIVSHICAEVFRPAVPILQATGSGENPVD